ncbi:MAG: squalene/phytoene synthase family protein [Gammaproteobacteria bacterium]|nr:squalene/phytoene synthase family protein [Gammaproteobacteria bacterium]
MILSTYSPRGSDIYYVLRKVPFKKREAYQALHAFCAELNQISEHYREPQVAEQKLWWWQDEIIRFFENKAAHPLLTALIPERERLSKTALLALIEANLLSLKTHIFETRAELFKHYQHLGGIQFDLKAQILGQTKDPLLHHDLGMRAEILRHLIQFRHFLQKQHLYFSLEDFRQYQIDPQPILQGRELNTLTPLFENYFSTSLNERPNYKLELKPLFLELKLKIKQIQQIKNDNWQWFKNKVELNALQKLFFTL